MLATGGDGRGKGTMELERSTVIEYIPAKDLKSHPLSLQIYGDDGWADLVESIKALGILQPLYIDRRNIIISGHRRWRAAGNIDKKYLLPCLRVVYKSELDEHEAIIEYNRARIKNGQQLYNEGTEVEKIEAERAKNRQLSSLKQGDKFPVKETYPQREGQTRDIVAEKIGLGSGKQWDKLKVVAENKPELLDQIKPDGISLNKAFNKARGNTDENRKSPVITAQYDVGIKYGDFRDSLNDIPPKSVKAILTDPPYGKEYLPLWSDLGTFASRVLREDGILIAYSGQMYLPEVIFALKEHLDWWWLCGLIHEGSGNLTPLGQPVRKVINQFKPILLFVPKGGGVDVVFHDFIPGHGKDKSKHNWQQPSSEAKEILQIFCKAGDLVVDPFAGSGAVGQAALDLQLQFIGAEILG